MAQASGIPALVLDGDQRLAGIVSEADLERAAGFGTAPPRPPAPAWR
jgi:CBS domain-containing protein